MLFAPQHFKLQLISNLDFYDKRQRIRVKDLKIVLVFHFCKPKFEVSLSPCSVCLGKRTLDRKRYRLMSAAHFQHLPEGNSFK